MGRVGRGADGCDVTVAHPEFVPDPTMDRDEMESLQRAIAEQATFVDRFDFDLGAVGPAEPSETPADGSSVSTASGAAPIVAGVDQAFTDDRAVSAVVAWQRGEVIERVAAAEPVEIPYVPGLLSFREGGSILAAATKLSVEPDVWVFDGSGRIHFRQAGLATHVGVTLDVPAVGVAKNLLCGDLAAGPDGRPVGWRAPIRADDSIDVPGEPVVGYAYQSRQYDERPIVNPLYVSPGHRVSAETAVELVARTCGGYKLPEPTRLADKDADEAKADFS